MSVLEMREADIERFTEGDCHILARALHKLTGWKICTFHEGDLDPTLHVFVIDHEKEYALDVEGLQPIDEFVEKWEYYHGNKQKLHIMDGIDWAWCGPIKGKYSVKRARIIAKRLVEAYL